MKYPVILIDLPHSFKVWGKNGHGKSAERHYPTMTQQEMVDFAPVVRDFAARDCAMFFWWAWPKIFSAEEIIKAYGFKFSGLAWEWQKFNPVTKKYAFGGGYGTRKNFEPCLLARRGKPVLKSRSERDMIIAPRREHSRKPDEQYQKIMNMFEGPYLELFATQRFPGWDTWAPKAHAWREANAPKTQEPIISIRESTSP